jgi:hypothetical protein
VPKYRASWVTGGRQDHLVVGAEFFDGDGGGAAKVVWRCEEDTGETSGLAPEDRARLRFTETEDEMYFFGIIDILTEYKAKKKVEHVCTGPLARVVAWLQGCLLMQSVPIGSLRCADVSCQPPPLYADRFLKFMGAAFEDGDCQTNYNVRVP